MSSFLFSITNNHKITLRNKTYALCKSQSYGPTFGGGHDLHICDKSNTKNGSYAQLGHSYDNGEYFYNTK
jgi:hypothetical protein